METNAYLYYYSLFLQQLPELIFWRFIEKSPHFRDKSHRISRVMVQAKTKVWVWETVGQGRD